jgi:LysM repeat protein
MRLLLKTFIVLFTVSLANAQFEATEVTRSDKIIHYQGVDYYLHTVSQGQTLYRICQTYGVTQDEISQNNPGIVLNPLSIGVVLRIPVKKDAQSIQINPDTESQDFIYHRVEANDNVYSLSKKYGVSEELIYRYNPESRTSIRLGEIIRIPVTVQPNETDNVLRYRRQPAETRYRVRQGDTLYRIAKTYDVSVKSLILANPELRWGLKTGQEIRIPQPGDTRLTITHPEPDSVYTISEFGELPRYVCDSIIASAGMRPPVKVVLLLPFFAKENQEDNLIFFGDTLEAQQRQKKNRLKGRVAAEFYEGFLLSVDTLRRTGINISLFVYDTEGDTIRVKQILRELDIVEPDVIIGPFSQEQVKLVSRFSFERKIPFVPPLATYDSLYLKNPYLFRVIPSSAAEEQLCAEYIARSANKNIILAYKDNLKTKPEADRLKRDLFTQIASEGNSFDTLRLKEVYINDSLAINIEKALDDSIINLVYIISSYEPDVINVLARLHFMMREHDIEVFGKPAWQKFDNVRIDVMHELQVTVFSPFYINYNDYAVRQFVKKCRNVLKYEPYMTTSTGTGINYTYLGYDLGLYFIGSLYNYGEHICDCAEYTQSRLLMSDYHYQRNRLTGVNENTSFRFILYNKSYIQEELSEIP